MEEALQAESAKFQDAVADVLTKEQKAEFETYLSGARDNRMRWGGPPRTN
jgi:Spy/CpxP family protein refolding chaperone